MKYSNFDDDLNDVFHQALGVLFVAGLKYWIHNSILIKNIVGVKTQQTFQADIV